MPITQVIFWEQQTIDDFESDCIWLYHAINLLVTCNFGRFSKLNSLWNCLALKSDKLFLHKKHLITYRLAWLKNHIGYPLSTLGAIVKYSWWISKKPVYFCKKYFKEHLNNTCSLPAISCSLANGKISLLTFFWYRPWYLTWYNYKSPFR